MSEAESIPVDEETLERVRSGLPLRQVGRIDLRSLGDRITLDTVARARAEHRQQFQYGHEAPIRLRERQAEWLTIACGYGAEDEDGNPRDFAAPGSRIFGHELWVEPEPNGRQQ